MIKLLSIIAILTAILAALIIFIQLTVKNNLLDMPIPHLIKCTAPCAMNILQFSQQRGTTQIKDDALHLLLVMSEFKESRCWKPTPDIQWYGCITPATHADGADRVWMRALHTNVKLGDILSVFGKPVAWRACVNRNELPDLSYREYVDIRFWFQFTDRRIEVHAKQLIQKSGNYLSPAASVDEIDGIVTTVPLPSTDDLRNWNGFSTMLNLAHC